MEQVKKSRSANRTHDDIRDELNERKAKHYMHIAQIDRKLEALDAPKQPRKARALSLNKVLAEAKTEGVTPEEIMEFLRTRKEAVTV